MKHESLYLAQKSGIGSGNISTYISHLKVMPSQCCIIKELEFVYAAQSLAEL